MFRGSIPRSRQRTSRISERASANPRHGRHSRSSDRDRRHARSRASPLRDASSPTPNGRCCCTKRPIRRSPTSRAKTSIWRSSSGPIARRAVRTKARHRIMRSARTVALRRMRPGAMSSRLRMSPKLRSMWRSIPTASIVSSGWRLEFRRNAAAVQWNLRCRSRRSGPLDSLCGTPFTVFSPCSCPMGLTRTIRDLCGGLER
jgi:hypothetical protein